MPEIETTPVVWEPLHTPEEADETDFDDADEDGVEAEDTADGGDENGGK